MRSAMNCSTRARFLLLVLVVQTDAERVVGIVSFAHEVGDGRLVLQRGQLALRVARREPEPRTE